MTNIERQTRRTANGRDTIAPGLRHGALAALLTLLTLVAAPRAQAQVTAYAYIPSSADDAMTFVPTNDRIAAPATITDQSLGRVPAWIAASPDGRYVYVTDCFTDSVRVINVPAFTLATTPIPVGNCPQGIAVSPDGSRIYVANTAPTPSVSVIRAPDHVVDHVIPIPGARAVWAVALAPETGKLYVTSLVDTLIFVIDLASRSHAGSIAGIVEPFDITIAPGGLRAYVTDTQLNSVVPINLNGNTGTLQPGLPVGARPAGLALNASGQLLAVASNGSHRVDVIDLPTLSYLTFTVGDNPFDVAFTPTGEVVYSVNYGGNSVSIIRNPLTVDTRPVGIAPPAVGQFMGPNIIVPDPLFPSLQAANDTALRGRGFKDFLVFSGGTLRLTGHVATSLRVSLLAGGQISTSGGGTIDTNGFDMHLNAAVGGAGRLTKIGSGSVTFQQNADASHAETYLEGGVLFLNGTTHAPPITVRPSGQLFGGAGATIGSVRVDGGLLSAGAPDLTGILGVSSLRLEAGARLHVDIRGNSGTYDQIRVAGPVVLDNARLDIVLSSPPAPGTELTILTSGGGVTGAFNGLPDGTILYNHAGAQLRARINYRGNDVVLTVLPPQRNPTITALADQTIPRNAVLGPIPFTIGDELGVDLLSVVATSSNQALLPTSAIAIEGSGANRTLTARPAANQTGTTEIRVTVSDGVLTSDARFTLTVTPENNRAPSITGLRDSTIGRNTTLTALPFVLDDDSTPADELNLTASSSNPALLPVDRIIFDGSSGAMRTLTATPLTDQTGTTVVTVEVSDGSLTARQSFTLTVTAAAPELTYLLAEGATGAFFDTDILLANPHDTAMPVTLTFFKEDGTTVVDTRTLAPMSRATIRVDTLPGLAETSGVATQVTSPTGVPLLVERTMRWDAMGYGAHTEKATAGAATDWYFAEGALGFFSTYFLLVNPHQEANVAHVTFLREGLPPLVRDYPLGPSARFTLDASGEPGLVGTAFGARITFDRPGVAERAMYFGANPIFIGGHESSGVTTPSTRWFLAEGATGSFFSTYILLANPGTESAIVTLTYLPVRGAPVTRTRTVPAGGRVTIPLADEDRTLADAAIATRVDSTRPIVVERAQYWPNPNWHEAHNSFGVTEAARRWGLAEGRVGGAQSYQTYILLANPSSDVAEVTLTFLRATGAPIVKTFNVPPFARFNVAVTGPGGDVPELANEHFGAIIDSTQPVAVERAMYSDVNGVVWAAGTNATATRLP
jgi:YVTN family beta-propeller protein